MKTKTLKKYQKPHTECFPAISQCHIMEWSAPKYKGEDGPNIPEARQYDMPEEEEESFGYKRYNPWSY